MHYCMYIYEWSSRDLRRVIVMLLKSWVAKHVSKINYVQEFGLNDKNIEKKESKVLLVNTDDEDKLQDFLSKNVPQMRRVFIS